MPSLWRLLRQINLLLASGTVVFLLSNEKEKKKNHLWHWDVSLKVLLLHWPLESLKLKLQLIHSKYIRLYGIYFCPKFISVFIVCFKIFFPSFALVVRIRFACGMKNSECQWLNLDEVEVKVLGAHSCLTLCSPMDSSPRGSSSRRILQARILECVAIPFSGDLPDSGIKPRFPALQAVSLQSEPPYKLHFSSGKILGK